ncbi:MAG: HAD-IA family hydrolase [Nocardioides sp.]
MPQDQGKPDPEVYLRCLARLDADLSEVVAVEDSTAGVTAALRAGLESWLLDSAVARVDESDAEAMDRLRHELVRLGLGSLADGVRRISRRLTLDDLALAGAR